MATLKEQPIDNKPIKDKPVKDKPKKFKLKNIVENGDAKNKTYRMKEKDGKLYPRDSTYPLTGNGVHELTDATEVIK